MRATTMRVRVTLPDRDHGEWDAARLVAEGNLGTFGILPNHQDWVSVLVAGIVALTLEDEREIFVAIDGGLLVKQGHAVVIAARRAVQSEDLAVLARTVHDEFQRHDAIEVQARAAASKLELGFVRRFIEIEELGRG